MKGTCKFYNVTNYSCFFLDVLIQKSSAPHICNARANDKNSKSSQSLENFPQAAYVSFTLSGSVKGN